MRSTKEVREIPWFKVDDALSMHPKAFTAGNSALGLWVRAGSWAMQHLTDGHIPAGVVSALGGVWDDAAALVNAGLWDQAEGGYQFHDWAEYQPTREQILAERAKTRERVEKHRANKSRSDGGNGVTNPSGTSAPSQSQSQSHTQDYSKTSESRSRNNRASGVTDEPSAAEFKSVVADQYGIDVRRVRAHIIDKLGMTLTPTNTVAVAVWILNKKPDPPHSPTKYVLGAITRSPAEVEQHIYESGLA